jgi:hypothetical protein
VAKGEQIKQFEQVSKKFDEATKKMGEINNQIVADRIWETLSSAKTESRQLNVLANNVYSSSSRSQQTKTL